MMSLLLFDLLLWLSFTFLLKHLFLRSNQFKTLIVFVEILSRLDSLLSLAEIVCISTKF